ncbi:unnamed protein product [Calicophoron daubneyi]|uniref:Zinc finger CW-type PWWP domain protein 1 n=1 Tax=Calicophoron daubneyi TaxID=300641 RepID=A0AAV2T2I6_CALDB
MEDLLGTSSSATDFSPTVAPASGIKLLEKKSPVDSSPESLGTRKRIRSTCHLRQLVDECLEKVERAELDVLIQEYFPRLHQFRSTTNGQVHRCVRSNSPVKRPQPALSLEELQQAARTLKALCKKLLPARRRRRKREINQFYENKNSGCNGSLPGTWVECHLCKKWRYLPHIHDPSLLEVEWQCSLDPKLAARCVNDTEICNPCDVPQSPLLEEDEGDFIFTSFAVGSVVWAKIQGYPEWPAMVYYNRQGKYCEFDSLTRNVAYYHVVFLDPTRSTVSRVRADKIRKFTSRDELNQSLCTSKYRKRLEAAAQEAEDALLLSIQDRLNAYGYDYTESPKISKRQKTKSESEPFRTSKYRKRLEAAAQEAEDALLLSIQDRLNAYGYDYNESPKISKRQKTKSEPVSFRVERKPCNKRGIAATKKVGPPSSTEYASCSSLTEASSVRSSSGQDEKDPFGDCLSPGFLKPADEEYFMYCNQETSDFEETSGNCLHSHQPLSEVIDASSKLPFLHNELSSAFYMDLAQEDLKAYCFSAAVKPPIAKQTKPKSTESLPLSLANIPFYLQLLPTED